MYCYTGFQVHCPIQTSTRVNVKKMTAHSSDNHWYRSQISPQNPSLKIETVEFCYTPLCKVNTLVVDAHALYQIGQWT